MKNKILILLPFVFLLAVLSFGCDSPTDSKAISTAAPSLVSPTDGATGISLTPQFKWTGTADKILYATNPNFENGISVTVSGNEHTLATPLNPNTLYFWKAGRSSGSTTIWSEEYWRFSTGN